MFASGNRSIYEQLTGYFWKSSEGENGMKITEKMVEEKMKELDDILKKYLSQEEILKTIERLEHERQERENKDRRELSQKISHLQSKYN